MRPQREIGGEEEAHDRYEPFDLALHYGSALIIEEQVRTALHRAVAKPKP